MRTEKLAPGGASFSGKSNGSRHPEATAPDTSHQARKRMLASTRTDCIRIITRLVGEGGLQSFLKSQQPAFDDCTGDRILIRRPVAAAEPECSHAPRGHVPAGARHPHAKEPAGSDAPDHQQGDAGEAGEQPVVPALITSAKHGRTAVLLAACSGGVEFKEMSTAAIPSVSCPVQDSSR